MKKIILPRTLAIPLFTGMFLFYGLTENSSALHNRVKTVAFHQQGTSESVTILTEAPHRITHFSLHDPERVVVNIHQAFIPGISNSKRLQGRILKGIRTHQNQKDIVRVVLDINENIPYSYKIEKQSNTEINIILSAKSPASLKKPSEIIQAPPAQPPNEDQSQSVALLDSEIPDDIFEDTAKEKIEPNFSLAGSIRLRATAQRQKNNEIENNTSIRNRVLLKARYKKKITVSALSDYLYFGSENKNDEYDIDLHEAKWEHLEKNYAFSLGKQIIRWGKADQISPVDTLNPEDLREFILPEYEERKIPVWMANARLFVGPFTLEGVVIPFFEKSKLHYFDTDWSVFGHVKKELTHSLPTPEFRTYVENLSVKETAPDNEAEFALRLQTTVKELDLGLTFHRMIEDTPYFKTFPVKNIKVNRELSAESIAAVIDTAEFTDESIEVEYKRTNALGFEFETTWKNLGLRGEAVWKEDESFLNTSLTSSRHPTLTYVVGLDYTSDANTYINLQFLHSHIYDYSPEILYFEDDSFFILGEFRIDLISDWLQAIINYNIALDNNSCYFFPYLKYTYFMNLECIVGTHLFYGDNDTWFGKFKDYDLFYLNVLYSF